MKKRILALMLVITVFIIPARAVSVATNDGTFTGTSNRKFYTPVSCSIESNSQYVYFNLLKWQEHYEFGSLYYWEGELRNPNIADAYSNVTAVIGSLPYLYKEYDKDDASIGCRDMAGIVGGTNYYARLTMEKGPKYDQGVEIYFESEYGIYGITDGLPLNYQTFATPLNTKSRKNIAWLP